MCTSACMCMFMLRQGHPLTTYLGTILTMGRTVAITHPASADGGAAAETASMVGAAVGGRRAAAMPAEACQVGALAAATQVPSPG